MFLPVSLRHEHTLTTEQKEALRFMVYGTVLDVLEHPTASHIPLPIDTFVLRSSTKVKDEHLPQTLPMPTWVEEDMGAYGDAVGTFHTCVRRAWGQSMLVTRLLSAILYDPTQPDPNLLAHRGRQFGMLLGSKLITAFDAAMLGPVTFDQNDLLNTSLDVTDLRGRERASADAAAILGWEVGAVLNANELFITDFELGVDYRDHPRYETLRWLVLMQAIGYCSWHVRSHARRAIRPYVDDAIKAPTWARLDFEFKQSLLLDGSPRTVYEADFYAGASVRQGKQAAKNALRGFLLAARSKASTRAKVIEVGVPRHAPFNTPGYHGAMSYARWSVRRGHDVTQPWEYADDAALLLTKAPASLITAWNADGLAAWAVRIGAGDVTDQLRDLRNTMDELLTTANAVVALA